MQEQKATRWTRENALVNVRRYCAYQERCHSEVRYKLLSHGIYGEFLEEIISSLIEDNYLNEERFAIQFAGGKHRIKGWGKEKIRNELMKRDVSAYSIRMALDSLDENAYLNTLLKLLTKWSETLTETNKSAKLHSIVKYGISKGYSYDEIRQITENILK